MINKFIYKNLNINYVLFPLSQADVCTFIWMQLQNSSDRLVTQKLADNVRHRCINRRRGKQRCRVVKGFFSNTFSHFKFIFQQYSQCCLMKKNTKLLDGGYDHLFQYFHIILAVISGSTHELQLPRTRIQSETGIRAPMTSKQNMPP